MRFRDDPDGDRFFALRTFRRDGRATATPVWLAPVGDRWYAYTPSRSWKVVRIRRTPRIEIAPSTFDGTPTGAWLTGSARILPRAELPAAKRAMLAKYGTAFRWFVLVTFLGRWRRRGGPAVGLEFVLDEPSADDTAT
ncbi:PPOX class F420-dependent oxidoreductase [Saccharomonospora piscinae]|uniref:PPOX class F420-dependent oxidoreductase n=1 Tax=Saccharomonospora piscinae TaxID=687388 RepID=UPI00055A9E8D|nr:PPOX class F420-dependent oxidoreductase [Saccharomonospora piscinae]